MNIPIHPFDPRNIDLIHSRLLAPTKSSAALSMAYRILMRPHYFVIPNKVCHCVQSETEKQWKCVLPVSRNVYFN